MQNSALIERGADGAGKLLSEPYDSSASTNTPYQPDTGRCTAVFWYGVNTV